jgi:signal transduction histidine kinase
MAGLGMLAQALETSLERASSAQAGKAEELVRHLDRAREQLRRITQGMMPVEVPGGKLALYLKELCTTLAKQYDVKCRLKIKSRAKLDGTVGTHLYHIAREAIINALKHGKPKSVRIALTPKPEGIRLTIEDDGTGLVHSPRFAAGSGIRIMQHRAKSIGATLDILPRKGHGTMVACTLPRHRRAGSEPAPGAGESRSPRRV